MARLPERPHAFFSISPAEASEAKCFAIRRGRAAERIDSHFHQPRFRSLLTLLNEVGSTPLGSLVHYSEEVWDRSDETFFSTFPYIEIAAVGLDTNEYKVSQVRITEVPSRARQVVRADDVLISLTRPHRGAVALISPLDDGAIASTGFAVARYVDNNYIDKEYILMCLTASFGRDQLLMRSSGGSYPAITKDELSRILIPDISIDEQHRLVAVIAAARSTRNARLAEADALLAGMDEFIFGVLGLSRPGASRSVFAIKIEDIDDVINPDRYRGFQIENHLDFDYTLSEVVSIVENKWLPEKKFPDEEIDLIRIDDLPNHPLNVETIRTVVGRNIQGAFFEVRENDILIARLGPTIQNAKFVLCPRLVRRTIASPEFLVLRCKKGYQPEAVLGLLRTALYREIMYRRTRGATPSRFRLHGNDLLTIPFPDVRTVQTRITAEMQRRQSDVIRLRSEAEAGWQEAKRWFERQLLEPHSVGGGPNGVEQ